MQSYKILYKCLCCDGDKLVEIINLGDQPLANNFHDNSKKLQKYPLKLNVCCDCWHCQLSIAVNPELMFNDYLYVSGTTNTLKEYFKWFANYVMTENPDTVSVLDIGCNDGSQLDEFKNHKVTTVGIEPAFNLLKLSRGKGHYIENQYFNKDFKFSNASGIEDSYSKFNCIIAQNVFAHNSNPLEFLEKCEQYLHTYTGTLYIQVSQADMIKNNEFDTIYHEHISFFSINSMNTLVGRTKTLQLVDVIKTPIHGNSYIFVIKKKQDNWYRVQNLLELEKQSGLYSLETYIIFKRTVERIRAQVRDARLQNKKIPFVGYGAAAKGMTALNYFDIPLDCIIDDNPLKQGLYTPGLNIPICSIDILKEEYFSTRLVLVPLAWNFFNEIQGRILAVRGEHTYDRYLKYFPKVQMI